MKLFDRLAARRRRKLHEQYEQERARQQALQGEDAQQAVRDVAQGSGAAQQGMYGQS